MRTELLERLKEADSQLDELGHSLTGSLDVRALVQGKSLSDIDAELEAILGAVGTPQRKGRPRKGKHSAPPPPPASVRPKAPSIAPPEPVQDTVQDAAPQHPKENLDTDSPSTERPPDPFGAQTQSHPFTALSEQKPPEEEEGSFEFGDSTQALQMGDFMEFMQSGGSSASTANPDAEVLPNTDPPDEASASEDVSDVDVLMLEDDEEEDLQTIRPNAPEEDVSGDKEEAGQEDDGPQDPNAPGGKKGFFKRLFKAKT